VLNIISTLHHYNQTPYDQTYDEHGNALPALMCAWLQGIITSSEIKLLTKQEIQSHPEWFECQAERRIIENVINMIFTPKLFINSRKVSPTGIAFIKRCKKEGHKIYGLSNWDAESFILLKNTYPELFDLFDGIIVSGQVHANKPHQAIYQALLNQYSLDPHNCWFIDDQKENILAAQKLGINAVLYKASFTQLIKNIRLIHSKSVTRRENFKNNGINESATKKSNNAIIDGEKISFIDSTKYNCLPANA
jgi:FMN phosphatase YigB (HAD superfamily)